MSQSNEITVTEISTVGVDSPASTLRANAPTTETVGARASTKDAGRVHIGGGMMHFHSTRDAGRVHVGGGMMRF